MAPDDIADAVVAVLLRLDRIQRNEPYARRWSELVARAQTGRVTCDGCGCLCWPDEACPGCRARRRRIPVNNINDDVSREAV